MATSNAPRRPLLALPILVPFLLLGAYIVRLHLLSGPYGQLPYIIARATQPGRKAYPTDLSPLLGSSLPKALRGPAKALDDAFAVSDLFFRTLLSGWYGRGALLLFTSLFAPINTLVTFTSGLHSSGPANLILLGPWTWFVLYTIGNFFLGLGPVSLLLFVPLYTVARLLSPSRSSSRSPASAYKAAGGLAGLYTTLVLVAMIVYSIRIPGGVAGLRESEIRRVFNARLQLGAGWEVGWRPLKWAFIATPLPILLLAPLRFLPSSTSSKSQISRPPSYPAPTTILSTFYLLGLYMLFLGYKRSESLNDAVWFMLWDNVTAALALLGIFLVEHVAFGARMGPPRKKGEDLTLAKALSDGPGAVWAVWMRRVVSAQTVEAGKGGKRE